MGRFYENFICEVTVLLEHFDLFHAGKDSSSISMFIKVIPAYFMLNKPQHYF